MVRRRRSPTPPSISSRSLRLLADASPSRLPTTPILRILNPPIRHPQTPSSESRRLSSLHSFSPSSPQPRHLSPTASLLLPPSYSLSPVASFASLHLCPRLSKSRPCLLQPADLVARLLFLSVILQTQQLIFFPPTHVFFGIIVRLCSDFSPSGLQQIQSPGFQWQI